VKDVCARTPKTGPRGAVFCRHFTGNVPRQFVFVFGRGVGLSPPNILPFCNVCSCFSFSAAVGKKCQHHLAREPVAIEYPFEPPASGPTSFPIHTVQCATPYAYSLQYRPRYLLALLLLARQANLRSASNTSFNGRESYLYGAQSSVQYTRSQRHIVTSRYNMRGMNSRDTRM
jgi:hypothetical protein